MDAVIVIAVVALLLVVPVLLWPARRGRLALGLGDAGRYYNDLLGLGEPGADEVVSPDSRSSAPLRPRQVP